MMCIAGKTGEVILDDVADRIPIYWLWHGGPDADEMRPWLEINTASPPGQVSKATTHAPTTKLTIP